MNKVPPLSSPFDIFYPFVVKSVKLNTDLSQGLNCINLLTVCENNCYFCWKVKDKNI